jgi:hypothetical protein
MQKANDPQFLAPGQLLLLAHMPACLDDRHSYLISLKGHMRRIMTVAAAVMIASSTQALAHGDSDMVTTGKWFYLGLVIAMLVGFITTCAIARRKFRNPSTGLRSRPKRRRARGPSTRY